jgi:hypothetical protein
MGRIGFLISVSGTFGPARGIAKHVPPCRCTGRETRLCNPGRICLFRLPYQAYSRPDAPSSLDPTQERRIFSPALLADIRRDRPASGEVGKLDHDPLCDCQDPDGLKVISITVAPATHGRAVAHVRLMFNVAITPITLTLVETHSGWRVDDVGTASSTSLRKFLIDNNEH